MTTNDISGKAGIDQFAERVVEAIEYEKSVIRSEIVGCPSEYGSGSYAGLKIAINIIKQEASKAEEVATAIEFDRNISLSALQAIIDHPCALNNSDAAKMKLIAVDAMCAKQPQPAECSGDDEYMCPNCCTPWKCNGPHIPQDERDFDEWQGVEQPAEHASKPTAPEYFNALMTCGNAQVVAATRIIMDWYQGVEPDCDAAPVKGEKA